VGSRAHAARAIPLPTIIGEHGSGPTGRLAARRTKTVHASAVIVALPLVVVLIVGLPGAPWVRWGLGVVVGAWLGLIAGLWVLIRREREDHHGERRPGWLRHALADAERFLREGGAQR
jgi:hypothetical protein